VGPFSFAFGIKRQKFHIPPEMSRSKTKTEDIVRLAFSSRPNQFSTPCKWQEPTPFCYRTFWSVVAAAAVAPVAPVAAVAAVAAAAAVKGVPSNQLRLKAMETPVMKSASMKMGNVK
jgi:hypothetical protein